MKILFSVLNMGLGHATRSLGLIKALVEKGVDMTVVSTGRSLLLLKSELVDEKANITFVDVPDYDLTYSAAIPLFIKMAGQLPAFLLKIKQENKICYNLVREYQIDKIVSDHRYGFYYPGKTSFFMSHQLTIMPPVFLAWIKKLSFRYHKKLLSSFNAIIVPDFEDLPALSGELSHGDWIEGLNLFYSGPLVYLPPEAADKKPGYDLVTIISGPEPQRSIFEKRIIDVLRNLNSKSAVILGRPESKEKSRDGNIDIFSYMDRKKTIDLIRNSRLVISRSGYTTVMELAALRKKAIFVPTPGQTEQEYLASYYQSQNWFRYVRQGLIQRIPKIFQDALQNSTGFPREFDVDENYRKAAQYIIDY